MDNDLLRKDAAEEIGVRPETLGDWEAGRNGISAANIPAVLDFLGGDPRKKEESIGARLKISRTAQGLSQCQLADLLGLGQWTISSVERGETVTPRVREIVERFLEGGVEATMTAP